VFCGLRSDDALGLDDNSIAFAVLNVIGLVDPIVGFVTAR
jgi:hypothetical protein